MKTRILIVDDHQILREALCNLFSLQSDLEVVGETGDSFEVVPLAQKTAPHIVFMDIRLPDINGIELTGNLLTVLPQLKVIALSTFADYRHVKAMLAAGACGFVSKVEGGDEVLRAIRMARINRIYLCPEVASEMANTLQTPSATAKSLSKREQQVLKLVAEGLTSIRIAAALNIAKATVEVHRRNIMKKLDCRSVAELTRYAISHE